MLIILNPKYCRATKLKFTAILLGTTNFDQSNTFQQVCVQERLFFVLPECSVKHIPKLLSQIDGSNLVDNLDGSYRLSYLVTSGSIFKLFVQFAGTTILLSWVFLFLYCTSPRVLCITVSKMCLFFVVHFYLAAHSRSIHSGRRTWFTLHNHCCPKAVC